jgi:hypothetical protein
MGLLGSATSKTGRTLYFNGKALRKFKGQDRDCHGGNYCDMETGESFWVSGVKRNGQDRHWAGGGKVWIEAAAVSEYLEKTGAKTLNKSLHEVTCTIAPTDVKRLQQIANTSYRDTGLCADLSPANPESDRR